VARRSYDQFCPLACTLDLVGERWTLLVVRDLVGGPKRYTDLLRGLPGVATDLLTERLRTLESAGVIARRELPPPGAATVYELTERGRELEPALLGLARFGLGLLGESPPPDEPPPPDRFALLLRVLFDPDRAPAGPETWVFESGDRKLGVTVADGAFEVHPDAGALPRTPSATLSGDAATLYDLVVGRLDPVAVLSAGRLALDGDPRAVGRLREAFPVPG